MLFVNNLFIHLYILLALCLVTFTSEAAPSGKGRVLIDDTYHDVSWSDGDSFGITSGRMRGQRVRLLGYNTLESYGPVHKWGDWNEDFRLYQICHIAYISYICSKLSDTECADSGKIICSKWKKYVANV